MYLKKIIAHGFKSFADKTVIDLTNGITGIVGPNGSGKSNVVDAIRWVLGEQSVKSLRGDGNMTDVIFSGSKSRTASSLASVTLVFDNTDNFIPLNFTEISIKRRVYKDGTNEYYLNGEQCRLKDINNILLDSGMAKESFNIISQGQIEAIISSKPADRRIMFEEAAGVLKYKKRKEEALKKLDKTNDNMNRVNDIINELEVRVTPLKIEKDKALNYIEKSEELEHIEVALISHDITNLNYKYKEATSQIEILSNYLSTISVNDSKNNAKIEEYKLKISKIDADLKINQNKLLELTTKAEKLNSRKAIIVERKKYEAENTKLHDNLIELKEKNLRLKNELDSLIMDIDTNTREYNEIILSVKTIEDSINKTKSEKNSLTITLSNTVKELNKIKNDIINLKNTIENNSLLPYPVKSVLNNPKLEGIHGILGNLITSDQAYSKAITQALVASNNIVCDNEANAKEAIRYLKTNELGRATFLPITVIKEKHIDSITLDVINKLEGYINVASNLVKYDKIYEQIVLSQLGNVIIVDNIDNGTKISKRINHKYKIVTLAGEVFNVGGSITGGIDAKKTSPITLKYELENKEEKSASIEHNITNIENNINEIDNKLRTLEDELYLLNKDKLLKEEVIKNKNNQKTNLTGLIESVKYELTDIDNIVNNKLSKEEEEIINEYYNTLNEKEKCIKTIENLQKEIDEQKETLETIEHTVRSENTKYNAKNNELKQLEIEVNRLDVKLDTLLNTLSETYNITYEKAVSLYRLELDESQARNKVNTLKRDLKEMGEVNLKAKEEYDQVSERYEFLMSQRNDLLNAQNTLLDIIKEMDAVMVKEFNKTFEIIRKNFKETFKELFSGGTSDLILTDPSNLLETGIEIIACPPGKKLKNISLLSGGEKTFTAISLLFAILKSRPVPFCVLDEVEAALDEANVDSFGKYVKKLQEATQFILITHKKKTMEFVDVLYGITMQESGVSKLVSVKLEEIN